MRIEFQLFRRLCVLAGLLALVACSREDARASGVAGSMELERLVL